MAGPQRLLKVLHVIPAVAARYGGPSQAVVGMGRALPARGVRVLIATTDADGRGRLPVCLGEPHDWEGVPTIFFRRQMSEAFKYSRPLARWLEHHVADFDVVHIHAVFSHACLAAAKVCRDQRVPYIVRPLGSLDPWSLSQKSLRKRVVWHFAARKMLTRAAAVHYTTLGERRLAEATLGLQRGVVVPNGVDLDAFSVAEPSANPYVLILGRLHPKKGLEGFLQAFVDAAPAEWRLLIGGDGDAEYVTKLMALASGNPRVVFTGWVGGHEKLELLQHASLLALPSFSENFGIVVVEAMACGVPVLVSPHVNLADEIETAGAGWVVPLEPAILRDGLALALADAEVRRCRGRAGRELAERFHWSAVANDLACLYEKVAA